MCGELNNHVLWWGVWRKLISLPQVRANKNDAYYWRRIPQREQCSVSLDPVPPEPVRDILLENIHFISTTNQLLFDLNWTPPVAYGQLMDYDVAVITKQDRDSLMAGSSIDDIQPRYIGSINVREKHQLLSSKLFYKLLSYLNNIVWFERDQSQYYSQYRQQRSLSLFKGKHTHTQNKFNSALPTCIATFFYCFHSNNMDVQFTHTNHTFISRAKLKMRAKNSYNLFSSWSSAVVIPLDGQCIVQPPSPVRPPLTNVTQPTDKDGSMISVFFEAEDGSRVRLLDVGCDTHPGGSEQSIHNRLQGIESRYNNYYTIYPNVTEMCMQLTRSTYLLLVVTTYLQNRFPVHWIYYVSWISV